MTSKSTVGFAALLMLASIGSVSAQALAPNTSRPIPLPLSQNFTVDTSQFSSYCQVYYTTVPAKSYANFSLCEVPAFALSAVYSKSDITAASNPIPATMPCRFPDGNLTDETFLSVSFPTAVMTSNDSSICTKQQNFLSQCYAENVTVFITMATWWSAKFVNGTPAPVEVFNRSQPRTVIVDILPNLQPPGDGNRTDCRSVNPTTTTISSTSRPGSAMGRRFGNWELATAVASAVVLVMWA